MDNYNIVKVTVVQISECAWHIVELGKSVDGTELFRNPIGASKALKRKMNSEQLCEPHVRVKPTKCKYLWVIEGELSKSNKSKAENLESIEIN